MNTTVLMILSDGSHRTSSWQTGSSFTVARAVKDQMSMSHTILQVVVAIGGQVEVYKGGEVDELANT